MARNEQLIRQLKLLTTIQESRFGRTEQELVDVLVDELGIERMSTRTIKRDLAALQFAGFDLEPFASLRGPGWKAGPRLRKLPEIPISVPELLALSVGRDLLAPLAGTPFWQGIDSLWNKMRQAVPETVREHFDQLRELLSVRGIAAKSYADRKGILSTLDRAIQSHRVVRIVYRSAGRNKPTTRDIEPYRILLYRGNLYVLAYPAGAPATGDFRTFKLDRFRAADLLDKTFRVRTDFDPDRHFAHSAGIFREAEPKAMRIRIDRQAADWAVETPWHRDQKVEPQSDGGIVLEIASAYEAEILPKVLALGGLAEVLAPAESRAALAAAANRLVKAHEDPSK